MYTFSRYVLIASLLFSMGCDSGRESMIFPNDGSLLISNHSGPYQAPDDPLEVLSASIDNDQLTIEVEFGGGCREHDIGLIADRNWTYSGNPVIRVTLTHDARGDVCRALVRETRSFRLSQLTPILGGVTGLVTIEIFKPRASQPFRPAPVWVVGNPFDALQISKASVHDNTLTIEVQYGGGCREHQIGMFWKGDWLESFPPQVTLQLTHNANDDPCDAWITDTRTFDLTFLDEAAGTYRGDVLLRLLAPAQTDAFFPLPVYKVR